MITVEDGSIVAGANSYVTAAEIAEMCGLYGIALPEDAAAIEVAARKGFMMINSLESEFQGLRVSAEQSGSFPRSGMIAYGFLYPDYRVPIQVKEAQIFAIDAVLNKGYDINAISSGQVLKSFELSGVIKEEYETGSHVETSNTDEGALSIPALALSLKPFFKTSLDNCGIISQPFRNIF